MNTPNNRRRKESQRRMEKAFMQLLQEKPLSLISVSEICSIAGVNRTTFYSNYDDIYALSERMQQQLHDEIMTLYHEEALSETRSHDFTKLLRHIKEHQLEYRTYFRLNPDGKLRFVAYDPSDAHVSFNPAHIDYHVAFFGNGFNAVIKMWLERGCTESPEEIRQIFEEEYTNRVIPK